MNDVTRRDAFKWGGAAGLALLAGRVADAVDKQPADKWRAWAITGGKNTKLTVEGIYSQGGPGVVVIVEEAMPQGTNPKILLLELKRATLPGIWAAVLEPVPASFTKAPYKKGLYDSVQIRYPDGAIVTIDKIIDAGDGPR